MLSVSMIDVQRRIAAACARAGRPAPDVAIIGVTKTVSVDRIVDAVVVGLRQFGENRVQEAVVKIRQLREQGQMQHHVLQWHMIGTLQRNKVRQAVELFDLIHSIDSAALAEEVNRQAERIGKRQSVLIQVNVTGEKTKHGVSLDAVEPLVQVINRLSSLSGQGFMTMAPLDAASELVRESFHQLRVLRDLICGGKVLPGHPWAQLSMGMSDDFELAIEEGATMVRIGRALFGERGVNP